MVNKDNSKRNVSIDYLKTLGLLLVILAHVDAPPLLQQLRSFDVSLMVFVSTFLFIENNFDSQASFFEYLTKRIKRLLIPTYIFLTFFWVSLSIAGHFPGWDIIIKSFMLQRDCSLAGYVWVIWIFIIVSISNFRFCRRKEKIHIPMIILCVVIYEMFCSYTDLKLYRVFYYSIFSIVPWSIWGIISTYYLRANDSIKDKMFLLSIFLYSVIFVLLFNYEGKFVPTSSFKYPARTYYFAYSLVAIHVLFRYINNINLVKNSFIYFISKSSLWIYLWHIFSLSILKYVCHIQNWLVLYFATIISAIFITYIQVEFIKNLNNSWFSKYKKYFIC